MLSATEDARKLEQQQLQQLSSKNDQELGKKNEEFKQAEANLQQRFAVEVAALNAKLAAAVDDQSAAAADGERLQTELNERAAEAERTAETCAAYKQQVQEHQMAITKLMDEKDEALALVPHHQKDNDKLKTELQTAQQAAIEKGMTMGDKLSKLEFALDHEKGELRAAQEANQALEAKNAVALAQMADQLTEKDQELQDVTDQLGKFTSLVVETHRNSLSVTPPPRERSAANGAEQSQMAAHDFPSNDDDNDEEQSEEEQVAATAVQPREAVQPADAQPNGGSAPAGKPQPGLREPLPRRAHQGEPHASGKPRLSITATKVLEEAFEAGRYAAGVKADQIALDAGITRKQVIIWFNNKRQRT